MNIELGPRLASRAGTTTEAHREPAELGSPQAEIDGCNDKNGIKSSQDPGPAAQSARISSNESCVAGRQGQETEGDTEPQNHPDQDENVHLIERDDTIILSEIKDLLMFMIKDDCTEAGGVTTRRSPLVPRECLAHLTLRTQFQGKDPEGRLKIVYCALNTFRKGLQGFPISLLACALSFEEPFRLSSGDRNHLRVPKSKSFLSTDFRGGYSVQPDYGLHDTIHWQIRYFSPTHEYEGYGVKCPFSKRQTAKLQHGSGETLLQEKRAVDEDIPPDTQSPDHKFDVDMFWKGYGFLKPNEVTPLTFYLLEICRAFKMCMDAWGETLNTIDKLVLVKLEDLDSLERVEELMFDNSFKRSKDYFVALQILRITDEWLDEVQLTVEDMFKDPVLLKASMWADRLGSDRSFEVAIRYVNEHATATKSRVRKKHDEINSLRDGLFNATSLRESTKAMALNQAIYVFTVVTVLFTPVSFLATFWALPFLNNPAEGSGTIPEPSAFRNSFIIMPLLTYALVIGVAWTVDEIHTEFCSKW
ncbi:hypothetical protein FPRO05_06242 [Fusarium proliferatum]|uniref:Uncharacterized protein n=1 Tax=Gibberella intermedia TaxID=948311 RepID=A0A365MP56_GIBIN|nr:hypothetical protein FPRO05_06242 [Fusarium proliferatum]